MKSLSQTVNGLVIETSLVSRERTFPRRLSKGGLAIFLIGLFLGGCAPTEEPAPTVRRKPSPTPVGKKFVFLSDAKGTDRLFLKDYFRKRNPQPETYFFEWKTPDDHPDRWDLAILRPWNLAKPVARGTVDLGPLLDRAFPLHAQDFFIPVSQLLDGESLPWLPITLHPDFLFVRDRPQWNFRFDRKAFEQEIREGKMVGMTASPLKHFYCEKLGIPDEQTLDLDLNDKDNPFHKGNLDYAIGPKGWLLENRIDGLAVIGLNEAMEIDRIPHAGYHVAISADCVEPDIAETLFRGLVTDGQSELVGIADSFPIRRSVYTSPRFQGPLAAFYKQAFDRTLSHLRPTFPEP